MTGKDQLNSTNFDSLYDPLELERERRRYTALLEGIKPLVDSLEGLRIFSAPGRTELGGNHTDHNRGRVLAASIQMDAVAVVAPRNDRQVFFRSAGFPDVQVNLTGKDGRPDLSPRPDEQGTTEALVRGIAAGFAARGVEPGGFTANASSTVLPGSGLSSSAAVEVLIAKIFDNLYGGAKCSALELAIICQKAENDFFGKPSGLMDQAASASGGVAAIDFANPSAPQLARIGFDPMAAGYALCVVNTRGSHANLTADYAAIPREMNVVAQYFGKSFLREIELSQVLSNAADIRKNLGDRALLRAIHFFNENRRVDAMAGLLREIEVTGDTNDTSDIFERFLDLVNESGDSSWELLQNIYSSANPGEQGLSLALAASREFFCEQGMRAACRVHGGGFAGTIQAYVLNEKVDAYRSLMESLFGPGALTLLRIRPFGAIEFNAQII